jgi:hypothetical protein
LAAFFLGWPAVGKSEILLAKLNLARRRGRDGADKCCVFVGFDRFSTTMAKKNTRIA